MQQEEEENDYWIREGRAYVEAEGHHADWEHIAQRDRQLRGAVLLQRSVRRFLNMTYERDAAARTIQAFFLRHVHGGAHSGRRHSAEENQRRRRRCHSGEQDARRSNTHYDRRVENATIRPTTPRHGGEHGGGAEAEAHDDQEELMWGRRRSSSLWSLSSEESAQHYDAASSHSTAPLSGSETSLWSSDGSSGGEDRGGGGGGGGGAYGGAAEQVGALAPQYEVFVWHHKQHALALAPCPATGFPLVADASCANVSLPGMWHVRDGDVLLSINDCSAHASELSAAEVEQVLDSCVRPAVLRFRRPTVAELAQRERAYTEEARRRGRRRSRGGTGSGDQAPRRRASVSSSAPSCSSASLRRDILRQRERCEASLCYVIWREEVPALGIRFQQAIGKPYPEVATVRAEGAAAGGEGGGGLLSPGVQPGDWLLSINDWGVRHAKFQHVLEVLHYSPRPLVLTFRRARRVPLAGERTLEL